MWKANSIAGTGAGPLSLRCPACRQQGTFGNVGVQDVFLGNAQPQLSLGIRRCPNDACQAAIFVVHANGKLSESFPSETVDFDSTNIPATVVSSFEEAIKCHANQCFIAAAIMVRKTLEELCQERHATGANLKERIKALGAKIVLPQDLLNGLDDLRLLGNDATHVESREYDKVG